MDASPPHTHTSVLLVFENMAFIILIKYSHFTSAECWYQQNVAGRANYGTSLPQINLKPGFDCLGAILDGVPFKKDLSTASLGQRLSHFPHNGVLWPWPGWELTLGAGPWLWPFSIRCSALFVFSFQRKDAGGFFWSMIGHNTHLFGFLEKCSLTSQS